ncbi:uncharacterized protein LOC119830738 [Zerene cesonia]|uniref:uncharacterized protein LOC119830738 n=1 Tax=Zerene cesonia TaxID=33412 RepID=UPI0018E4F5F2|nr:uncharacterized protein LOC119830738 [Zerene cesonia]
MEEPIDSIRQNNRSLLKLNRRTHRDEISDIRRSFGSCSSTHNTAEIIDKLKTKSAISARELNQLKNAIMEDPSNIERLLNVHGALRGIVRELTGVDIKKQCAAAGCCCNLAMGDSKACLTIAKATGTYLLAAVDNLATELAVTCIWTLGNLAASGTKACDVLTSQGALSKLTEPHANEEVQDACWYALKHFAYQMGDGLKVVYLQKILQSLAKSHITLEASQLLFVLSCHTDFPSVITEDLIKNLLETFTKSLENHIFCKQTETCCDFVYICRTLANTNDFVYNLILNVIVSNNMSDVLRKVLSIDNKIVNESLLWLLGNIYKSCGGNEFFNFLIS